MDYLKTRKSSSEIYWSLVMVAFLNSWMHTWTKTEIGLYSPAADFKKSSMAFFCFHICLAFFCAEGAAHIYNVARKRAQLGFKIFLKSHFKPIRTGVFLGQSWTGGLKSQPWGFWEIGAKHNFCDNFSEDYFEVYIVSVAQNLTILDAILRFCWKCQKIRPRF